MARNLSANVFTICASVQLILSKKPRSQAMKLNMYDSQTGSHSNGSMHRSSWINNHEGLSLERKSEIRVHKCLSQRWAPYLKIHAGGGIDEENAGHNQDRVQLQHQRNIELKQSMKTASVAQKYRNCKKNQGTNTASVAQKHKNCK